MATENGHQAPVRGQVILTLLENGQLGFQCNLPPWTALQLLEVAAANLKQQQLQQEQKPKIELPRPVIDPSRLRGGGK